MLAVADIGAGAGYSAFADLLDLQPKRPLLICQQPTLSFETKSADIASQVERRVMPIC